jgi:hypothetical protein
MTLREKLRKRKKYSLEKKARAEGIGAGSDGQRTDF